MKKYSLVLLCITLALSSCGAGLIKKESNNLKEDLSYKEIEFIEQNGNLTLIYDESSNQWVSLKATSNASIDFMNSKSTLDAFSIATLKAKALLGTFMSGNLRSKSKHTNMSKITINDEQKSFLDGQNQPVKEVNIFGDESVDEKYLSSSSNNQSGNQNNKIAQEVSQEIYEDTNAIIKGAFVTDRTIDKDKKFVSVSVMITRNSINAAQQIKRQIASE